MIPKVVSPLEMLLGLNPTHYFLFLYPLFFGKSSPPMTNALHLAPYSKSSSSIKLKLNTMTQSNLINVVEEEEIKKKKFQLNMFLSDELIAEILSFLDVKSKP
jgi:hypothetical protein